MLEVGLKSCQADELKITSKEESEKITSPTFSWHTPISVC